MNKQLEQADELLLESGFEFHPNDCEQDGNIVFYFSDETDNYIAVDTNAKSVIEHTPRGIGETYKKELA